MYRVLVTGFGPFGGYSKNPSWLAVSPLHNTVLQPEPISAPITHGAQEILPPAKGKRPARAIHITALQVPVTYSDVLSIVPGVHARPPILPSSTDLFPQPPSGGYDFVLHVGVAPSGTLRIERLAHKLGYGLPDADNKMPPDLNGIYTTFGDEMKTTIKTEKLADYLRESGSREVVESNDPGRYLCDFIYYCSLCEAHKTRAMSASKKAALVLFLHCSPLNQPHSSEEVTQAIKLIVEWISRQ
ncbi:peptidase C15, pyroglutamyl peptidase I-like protein [Rickenella mellea]|uniref:Peptidase C15, pyroglutamyl peptidase I-like protein n=1 Tax=Rickenella mellea TaxID=50990 RepID=A0A4Y7Q314_9AGAM|nr:peptidase C15, pyroglutamyl peptidase I-like protein [Rickenella mellea]